MSQQDVRLASAQAAAIELANQRHDKAVSLSAEVERLRADAERGRWLTEWLMEHGLLRAEFCKPGPGAECADWWILQKPYMVDRQSCEGYGKTEEEAIDAARKDKP